MYSANGRQDRRSEVPGIVAPLPRVPRRVPAARDVLRSSALRYLMRRTLDGKHYEHRDAYNVFLSSRSAPAPPRNRSLDDLFLYSTVPSQPLVLSTTSTLITVEHGSAPIWLPLFVLRIPFRRLCRQSGRF